MKDSRKLAVSIINDIEYRILKSGNVEVEKEGALLYGGDYYEVEDGITKRLESFKEGEIKDKEDINTRCKYNGRCIYKEFDEILNEEREIIYPLCRKPPFIDVECPYETKKEKGKLVNYE